jgi:ABC-type transport system involved in cytochrome c biogenesis permease subunit
MTDLLLPALSSLGFAAAGTFIVGYYFLSFPETAFRAGLAAFAGSFILAFLTLLQSFAGHAAMPFLLVYLVILNGIYLAARRRLKIDAAAALLAPVNIVLIAGHIMWLRTFSHMPSPTSPWFYLHVSAFLFSYGCFTLAAFSSFLYLYQARRLKRKKIDGPFQRIAPLGVLDTASYRLMGLGFPVLALGVAFGSLWSHTTWGTYWVLKPGGVTAIIITLLYLVCMHTRVIGRWQGVRVNSLLVAAFFLMLLAMLALGHLPLWVR